MIRRSLLALSSAAVAVALAGCGGGEDTTDLTADLSAGQLLERSAEAATGLDAFTLTVDGVVTPTLSGGGAPTGAIPLNGPIEVNGQGPVVQPDRLSLDATVSVGSLPLQTNFTRVGGAVYVSALGRDYRLGLPEAQVERVDASVVFPTLARWIADPEIEGRDTVDGQESVRISGSIDADEAAADVVAVTRTLGLAGGGVSADAVSAQIASQLGDDDRVTVWVRANDLAPSRMDLAIGIEDATALSDSLEAVDLELSLTLTDLNASLTVEPPADAQTLSLEDLSQLAGGLG